MSSLVDHDLLWSVPSFMPYGEPPWQTSLLGISSTPEIPVSPATWWPESPTQMVTYNGEFFRGNFPSTPDRPLSPIWNPSEVATNNIPSPITIHVYGDDQVKMVMKDAFYIVLKYLVNYLGKRKEPLTKRLMLEEFQKIQLLPSELAVLRMFQEIVDASVNVDNRPCRTSEKQSNLDQCGNEQHLGAEAVKEPISGRRKEKSIVRLLSRVKTVADAFNAVRGEDMLSITSGKQSNLDQCGNELHSGACVTPIHGSRARLVELSELERDETLEALDASHCLNSIAHSGKQSMRKMLKGKSTISEVCVEHTETPRAVCIPGSENANKHCETSKAANDSPSTNAVSVSVRKTSKHKYGISERTIPIHVLKQHFSMKLDKAAVCLDVSRSTLKRMCRQHGIARWPSQRRSNLSEITKSAKDILCSTTPAGNLNLHPNTAGPSEQQEQNGTLACKLVSSVFHAKERYPITVSNHHVCCKETPTRPDSVKELEQASGDQPSEISYVTTEPLARTLIMKAMYGEDMIRFDFCSNSEISKLKEEVAKRLNLDTASFDVKYLDNDNDWILMKCEEDLKHCIAICRQHDGNVMRLQIRKIL